MVEMLHLMKKRKPVASIVLFTPMPSHLVAPRGKRRRRRRRRRRRKTACQILPRNLFFKLFIFLELVNFHLRGITKQNPLSISFFSLSVSSSSHLLSPPFSQSVTMRFHAKDAILLTIFSFISFLVRKTAGKMRKRGNRGKIVKKESFSYKKKNTIRLKKKQFLLVIFFQYSKKTFISILLKSILIPHIDYFLNLPKIIF